MTRAATRVRRHAKVERRKEIGKGRGPRGTLRVNARLDADTAAILRQLVRETGLSVTDVIKLSLTRLSDQQSGPELTVLDAFGDLIGCFDGAADLAEGYKRELTESTARKHGAP